MLTRWRLGKSYTSALPYMALRPTCHAVVVFEECENVEAHLKNPLIRCNINVVQGKRIVIVAYNFYHICAHGMNNQQ